MRATLTLIGAGLLMAVTSCETTTPDRKGGGGAFDESYLAQRLDSNHPDPEANPDPSGRKVSAPTSHMQWKEERD